MVTSAYGEAVTLAGAGLYRHDTPFMAGSAMGAGAVTLLIAVSVGSAALAGLRRGGARTRLALSGVMLWVVYVDASLAFGRSRTTRCSLPTSAPIPVGRSASRSPAGPLGRACGDTPPRRGRGRRSPSFSRPAGWRRSSSGCCRFWAPWRAASRRRSWRIAPGGRRTLSTSASSRRPACSPLGWSTAAAGRRSRSRSRSSSSRRCCCRRSGRRRSSSCATASASQPPSSWARSAGSSALARWRPCSSCD